MFDFWVVTGRICLDEDFYGDLFTKAIMAEEFVKLTEMRSALKRTKVRLSRWEVMELHRLVTTEEVTPPGKLGGKAEKKAFTSAADNYLVAGVRSAAAPFARDLLANHELLAIVGLCCVDDIFRERLHEASHETPEDTEALHNFLADSDESPGFYLDTHHLVILNRLLRTPNVRKALDSFHQTMWVIDKVHKHFGACCPGHSGRDYKHLSSQEVAQVLDLQEEEEMKEGMEKPGTLRRQLVNAKAIV